MQEDFLHYIWNFKKFDFLNARTVNNLPLTIINSGTSNINSGPDFFNAKVQIGNQLWAGNVEIHINSSDWYKHHHEKDSNYDNVILHVVWQDDVEIFRKDNSVIPTLELRELVPAVTLYNYRNLLMGSMRWINCEKNFDKFTDFEISNWLEILYFERLEDKSKMIYELLKRSNNNWEEVLFKMITKGFGLNINGDSFMSIADSVDFRVLRKLSNSQFKIEAMLLGQAGLLEDNIEDVYFQKLRMEYDYLKVKFDLSNNAAITPNFFRLRPDNFPTLRLSQLSNLYAKSSSLFTELINEKELGEIYNILQVQPSEYWMNHYSFTKDHPPRSKKLTKSFMDLLLINIIIPIKFSHSKYMGVDNLNTTIDFIEQLGLERNEIIKKFNKLRPKTAINALQSQALLQLKKYYCDANACLRCRLGVQLIQGNN